MTHRAWWRSDQTSLCDKEVDIWQNIKDRYAKPSTYMILAANVGIALVMLPRFGFWPMMMTMFVVDWVIEQVAPSVHWLPNSSNMRSR